MDAALLAQYIIVALALLASVGVVMHKQFPHATRTLRGGIALRLLARGSASWMHALGRKIAPAARAGAANCAGCDTCE